MEIKDIENYIYQVSKNNVKLNFTPDLPVLSTRSMNSVIHGQNYNIDKLLAFIKVIGKNLYFEGHLIQNKEDFGKSLRKYRKEKKITRLDMFTLTGLCPSKIDNIETGKGYMKNTLIKYLSVFPEVTMDVR